MPSYKHRVLTHDYEPVRVCDDRSGKIKKHNSPLIMIFSTYLSKKDIDIAWLMANHYGAKPQVNPFTTLPQDLYKEAIESLLNMRIKQTK